MKKSNLKPFLRNNLDILFVGLNPATGSSKNKHYYSVYQSFWNQLYTSGLITKNIDKSIADNIIFGTNILNYNNWNYGITDLIIEIAESNSTKVKPKLDDLVRLKKTITKYKPKTVVILHNKVLKKFLKYLGFSAPHSNSGELGKLINNCETNFFNIAFPHNNSISSQEKVKKYLELKKYLEKNTP